MNHLILTVLLTFSGAIRFAEALSPCDEYDIMKRPNSDRTIDSTNPQDDTKLTSGGYEPWRSTQPAEIVVKSTKEVRVMRVVIPRVEGAKSATVTLLRHGADVEQVELDTKQSGPAVANFEKGPYADAVAIKFRNSNDIYTEIEVYGLSIFVCGAPENPCASCPSNTVSCDLEPSRVYGRTCRNAVGEVIA